MYFASTDMNPQGVAQPGAHADSQVSRRVNGIRQFVVGNQETRLKHSSRQSARRLDVMVAALDSRVQRARRLHVSGQVAAEEFNDHKQQCGIGLSVGSHIGHMLKAELGNYSRVLGRWVRELNCLSCHMRRKTVAKMDQGDTYWQHRMYAPKVGVYILEHLSPVPHELEELARDFRPRFSQA